MQARPELQTVVGVHRLRSRCGVATLSQRRVSTTTLWGTVPVGTLRAARPDSARVDLEHPDVTRGRKALAKTPRTRSEISRTRTGRRHSWAGAACVERRADGAFSRRREARRSAWKRSPAYETAARSPDLPPLSGPWWSPRKTTTCKRYTAKDLRRRSSNSHTNGTISPPSIPMRARSPTW